MKSHHALAAPLEYNIFRWYMFLVWKLKFDGSVVVIPVCIYDVYMF